MFGLVLPPRQVQRLLSSIKRSRSSISFLACFFEDSSRLPGALFLSAPKFVRTLLFTRVFLLDRILGGKKMAADEDVVDQKFQVPVSGALAPAQSKHAARVTDAQLLRAAEKGGLSSACFVGASLIRRPSGLLPRVRVWISAPIISAADKGLLTRAGGANVIDACPSAAGAEALSFAYNLHCLAEPI